ncbi:hypothetical protein, partial [Segatella copri]|uniref:hypothetical protein n=1 Tax=Segatella copri TaxID=165179 RepID=UPI001E5286B2
LCKLKSRTEILVPLAAIQAVPIAVIAWYRLHRYAWYRYSAIVTCWGDEVKGEGYILNLYIIFFFRAFSIFDPRVFFGITLFFLYPRVHI